MKLTDGDREILAELNADANDFTPEEREEYEAWLDTFDPHDRGDEGYSEPLAVQPIRDDETPF